MTHNTPRRVIRLATATVFLLLAIGAAAHAGIYHVKICPPSAAGTSAPGWNTTPGGSPLRLTTTCGTGPSAGLQRVQAYAPGTSASLTFTAPPNTQIVAGTFTRQLTTFQAGDEAYIASPNNTDTNAFDLCQGQCSHVGVMAIPAAKLPTQHLYMTAECNYSGVCPAGGNGPPGDWQALAWINQGDLSLQDNGAPLASAIGGALATAPVVAHTEDLQLTATDTGGGLFALTLEIDGRPVSSDSIDPNGGACQDLGGERDGNHAFLNPQPCVLSVNDRDYLFDLSGVPDGPHQLTLVVSDAASSIATVVDRSVIVDNSGHTAELLARGPCNAGCDDQARLIPARAKIQAGTLTRGYRHSQLTLAGQLVDHTGAPIPGATLELIQQPQALGDQPSLLGRTLTDATGHWLFHVPKGPSRVLLVGYRSRAKDPTYAAQLLYHEQVYATVHLHARPHLVSLGQSLLLRGRIAGGYQPPGGALIAIEIHYHGHWHTISNIRADQHGRFTYGYIFTTGAGRRWRFRASLPSNPALPFHGAHSAPVSVDVQ
jgi:hypothetical protein